MKNINKHINVKTEVLLTKPYYIYCMHVCMTDGFICKQYVKKPRQSLREFIFLFFQNNKKGMRYPSHFVG